MISTLKKYLIVLTFILLSLALPINAKESKNLVNIYFFHSKDCAHCKEEIKFLDSIEKKYDNVKIYRYEIHNEENNNKRQEVIDVYDLKSNGVPLTIIGNTPYMGYSENSSNIKFIKTIEYYSSYGYEDKVGKLLKIDKLPTYKINESSPTLDEFIKEYGNYKLIGKFYTNDLDATSNAIILGILSQFNLIKIISIIVIIVLLKQIKNTKTQLILLLSYLITSFLLNTIYIIPNSIYKLIIISSIVIITIFGFFKSIKNKKNNYLYNSIFNTIAVLSIYLENFLYPTNKTAFNQIITLHNMNGLNKINYYANYFFIIMVINLIFVLMYSFINDKRISD